MPKMMDYACICGARFEYLHMDGTDAATCPACNRAATEADEALSCSRPFGTIVPMYKGSLKQKAGYVHTHADRPAERGSIAVPSQGGGL